MQNTFSPHILWLFLAMLPALVIAQPMAPHAQKGVSQEVLLQSKTLNCGDLVFSLQVINNGSGCCYRLNANNSNPDNCFSTIALNLGMGAFANFTALPGWQSNTGGPAEYTVRPFIGFIPPGSSSLAEFCIDGTTSATLTLLWDDLCVLEGCAATFDVNGCLDPGNASITGVKYRECGSLPYTNQPVLSDWTIQLLDADSNVIAEQVTDVDGAYAFYDLDGGNYTIREVQQPGWTPNVPASGQSTVVLDPSENEVRDFGNCPGCSCDDIYMDVVQLPGSSDSCAYILNVSNIGAYCFDVININLTSGVFAEVIQLNDWTITVSDSQHLSLIRQTPSTSFGSLVRYRLTGATIHEMTVSTIYNIGMGNVSCSRAFSFVCPPPMPPPPCCPAGSQFGPELTKNGGFELGNQDFTNDYNYFNPGSPTTIGAYSVLNQTQVFAGNSQWASIDHTTFSSAGQMLIVDGYGGPIAWQQPVNVTAGTNYAYAAWFNNLVIPTKNYDDPQMALFVDNTQIAGPLNLPESPDQWIRLCGTWTAMTSGTVVLSIRMLATTNIGNDVAIDDISFRACIPPPPCQTSIQFTQNTDCTVTVCAVTTGPQPVSYQWCDGRTDACFTAAQLPCVPSSYCVTATCADGTTSTAIGTFTGTDITPPVAVCKPGEGVDLGSACDFQVDPAFVDGGSTDNCGVFSMTVNPSTLAACTNTIVTLTVTDHCGNTSTCTMGIQTKEGEPPMLTCPANLSVQGTINPQGICTGVMPQLNVGVSDNCDPNVQISISPLQGSVLPVGPTIVTFTGTDACDNTATCALIVTVFCEPGVCACPAGGSAGQNLISNGTFTAGDVGFGSLPLNCGCADNSHCVLPKFTDKCGGWTANFYDHTYGPTAHPLSQFLVIDGHPTTAADVWTQPVNVTSGKTYCFSFWVASVYPTAFNLGVTINGVLVDPSAIFSVNSGAWTQHSITWLNVSLNGTFPLTIQQMTGGAERDFGIDDICLREMTPGCVCGSFTDMYIRTGPGAPSQAVTCGADPIPLVCPQEGGSFNLTGFFGSGPTIKTIMVNSCGTEQDNEFLIIHSGAHGFNINDLQVDFDNSSNTGGTQNNDINIGTSSCGWLTGNTSMFAGCPSMVVAGPGTFIPANSYVVIQTSSLASSSSLYDFSAFCGVSQPVYVVRNACARSVQAFANTGGSVVHSTSISLNGSCLNSADIQLNALSNSNGAYFTPPSTYGNVGCNAPPVAQFGNGTFHQINWILSGPGISQTGSFSNNDSYFGIVLPPTYFTQSGLYTLNLNGDLSNEECTCDIQFNVNCPNLCPCDVLQFQKDVDKGFATALWNNSCNACFSPIALNDCDKVEWKVNNTSVGMTNGVESFCPSFSSLGTYTIDMIVSRFQANGSPCESFTFTKTVQITCDPAPVCDDAVFENPDFEEGAMAGGLNSGGATSDWLAPWGDPHVVIDDGKWKVRLTGNLDTADVLSAETAMCLEKGPGTVTLRGSINKSRSNIKNIAIFFNTGDNFEFNVFNPASCFRIATLDLAQYDSSWFDLEIPYDLSSWAALDACGDAPHGVLVKPIVYATSFLGNNQGGEETRAEFDLDYLCFDADLVRLDDLLRNKRLRIFPNPNPGTFTVELPEPAKPGLSFRIINLTGQLLREQYTQTGNTLQTVQAGDLPAGLYFLQVRSEGKVLATEKFIKQ
jgi:hypothetical protein